MDSEEYFERVVRFLETQGWNTSTTQVNETVAVVTGTRQSDTYYDRMMALVGLGAETTFGPRHARYLVDAAADHDVDRLLATTRGGFEDGTADLLADHDIEVLDPATVDDAFIDGFEVDDEEWSRQTASWRLPVVTEPFQTSATAVIAVYLIAAAVFGSVFLILGVVAGDSDTVATVLAAAIVLGGPGVGLVGAAGFATDAETHSTAGLFSGVVVGSILFVVLVGASGGPTGLTADTGLFDSTVAVVGVLGLSVPTGLGAVGLVSVSTVLGPA